MKNTFKILLHIKPLSACSTMALNAFVKIMECVSYLNWMQAGHLFSSTWSLNSDSEASISHLGFRYFRKHWAFLLVIVVLRVELELGIPEVIPVVEGRFLRSRFRWCITEKGTTYYGLQKGLFGLRETVFSVNNCFLLAVDCFSHQKFVQERIFFARVVLLVGFFEVWKDQQQMVSFNPRNSVIVIENPHSDKTIGSDKHQLLASWPSVNTRVWLQNLRLK